MKINNFLDDEADECYQDNKQALDSKNPQLSGRQDNKSF